MFLLVSCFVLFFFFFFNDTATTEIYTLSLHDALPISPRPETSSTSALSVSSTRRATLVSSSFIRRDRKSTRLNSSHVEISYAVFCLKKKKKKSYEFCVINKKQYNALD